MTATAAPRQAEAPRGGGLGDVLRSEWTKFRTVRGWVITAVAAGLLIVLFAYLGTFRHQDGGICVGPNPSSGTCRSFVHPHPPLGPGGVAVADTYYFVHRTLSGNGSITVRVGSLIGRGQGGSKPGAVSAGDLRGVAAPVQPWAKAGLILTATSQPGSSYAAVMVTGAHGVRMQYDYSHDIAGSALPVGSGRWLRLTRSGSTVTGYESADGRTWTRIGSARLALPHSVPAGLFVTSPPTVPSQQALVPGGNIRATGATATFGQPGLEGGWSLGGWAGQSVGASVDYALLPVLSSVGSQRSGSGFAITGSGDIAPSVTGGETDKDPLTGVFVGLIVMIVLGALFITGEYRRGLIHTTLTASPRRGSVLLAKAVVIGTVAFVVGSAAAAVSIPLGDHILRSNGNYVYPTGTLTQLRVILGMGALVGLAAVLALALGTVLRRGAGAVTVVIVLIILPYILALASALPAGGSQWLMRITPAAAFAVEQTLPQYHQVAFLYTPAEGFYPLAPGVGLAVLGAYALIALLVANRLLHTRDA